MKLLNIIKEDKEKFAYSWQKPDGIFLPIMYSHGSDAYDYLKKEPGHTPKSDHMMILWKRGWQRINFGGSSRGKVLYVNNPIMRPNDKQFKELKDLAIELDYKVIVYDNDEKDTIIWHADNIVENKSKIEK